MIWVSILLTASVAHAGQTAELPAWPTSQSEFYHVGEQFAHCSAYFDYAALMARRNSLEDTAVVFDGRKRGWRLAGLMFLASGLDEARQGEVQTLFDTMTNIQLDEIKAKRELSRASGNDNFGEASALEFQTQCGPYVEMQRAMIETLRSRTLD